MIIAVLAVAFCTLVVQPLELDGAPMRAAAREHLSPNRPTYAFPSYGAAGPATPYQFPSHGAAQRVYSQKFNGASKGLASTEAITIEGCGVAGDIVEAALTSVSLLFPDFEFYLNCGLVSSCTVVIVEYAGVTYADIDVCDYGKEKMFTSCLGYILLVLLHTGHLATCTQMTVLLVSCRYWQCVCQSLWW